MRRFKHYTILIIQKDLNDIKNFLTTNKGFLIDSNFEINFKKTKMNKVFFLKIIDFIGKEKKIIDELINLNLSDGWSVSRLPKVQLLF